MRFRVQALTNHITVFLYHTLSVVWRVAYSPLSEWFVSFGTMISKLRMSYISPLLPHTYTCTHSTIHMPTQDGVTADQVAELQGHHAVCEELRKHMHGGRRPLNKVSPTCALLGVA